MHDMKYKHLLFLHIILFFIFLEQKYRSKNTNALERIGAPVPSNTYTHFESIQR